MKLDDLQPGITISGFILEETFEIKHVDPLGPDVVAVYGVDSTGRMHNRTVSRAEAEAFQPAMGGRKWTFDADGNLFKLAAEALRIRLAHLFDPLVAVNTSILEPLPHQISAVYDHMLSRQPLRYLLADDPGAGKTIMAGLLIKELMLRGDVERCLIVVPGNLANQWQDELRDKLGLRFQILTNDNLETAATGNWFLEENCIIARLDKLSRDERLHPKLQASEWDLVIFDEAHKLSASYSSGEVKFTKRHNLARLVSQTTRHFLLMTATPHNGKEEDFQLFLSLLDGDRFEGRFRDGVHKIDSSDLMRRLIKEQLVRFDGSPLFTPRRAYTVKYKLSDLEAHLYLAVTSYVREEFNRAERLEKGRKGNVGFALTILQRRLASSPAAILTSLERRRKKLEDQHRELSLLRRGKAVKREKERWLSIDELEDLEDAPDSEVEEIEDEILLYATGAETLDELRKEIGTLKKLEELAREVLRGGQDRKWQELSRLLQEDELMFDSSGSRRKLVIFTEHKDTLKYLSTKIRNMLGSDDAVVNISGSTGREERRKAEARFKQDREARILVATDAAGEGINLQRAHLMINYDLPWNPNRIEQRFGRIHRIGQTEVCHLWNMVAHETREGSVFERLLSKLATESDALQGRVFDVMGEVFEGASLRDLLIKAIRSTTDDEVKQVFEVLDELTDTERLNDLVNAHALATNKLDSSNVQRIRDMMERARLRKLQPYDIAEYFKEAFRILGGTLRPRESTRFEIRNVPAIIRDRDRIIGTGAPVLRSYERITFDPKHIELQGKPTADLITSGHPLLASTIDLTLERHRSLLRIGAMLIDTNVEEGSSELRVLLFLDHTIRDGRKDRHGSNLVASRRLQFVEVGCGLNPRPVDHAPYINYRPATEEERQRIAESIDLDWADGRVEKAAIAHAAAHIVPDHFDEVRTRRHALIEKSISEVRKRLTQEIGYWDHRAEELRLEEQAGRKNARLNAAQAQRRVEDLRHRLNARVTELENEKHLSSEVPIILGAALVIPVSMIESSSGKAGEEEQEGQKVDEFGHDKKTIEAIAMRVVTQTEEALGNEPVDVSSLNRGWDIESRSGETGELSFIEVKGRSAGATTITVSKNEVRRGFNNPEHFILAVVFIGKGEQGNDSFDGPHYVKEPFDKEPGWAEASVNLDVDKLLGRAYQP